jgi:hypothetical protein
MFFWKEYQGKLQFFPMENIKYEIKGNNFEYCFTVLGQNYQGRLIFPIATATQETKFKKWTQMFYYDPTESLSHTMSGRVKKVFPQVEQVKHEVIGEERKFYAFKLFDDIYDKNTDILLQLLRLATIGNIIDNLAEGIDEVDDDDFAAMMGEWEEM